MSVCRIFPRFLLLLLSLTLVWRCGHCCRWSKWQLWSHCQHPPRFSEAFRWI